LTRL
jgi:hypothetical protein